MVLLALAVCTWVQVGYWYDTLTLWSHAAEVTDNNYYAHLCLGDINREQNNLERARVHLTESLRIIRYMGIEDTNVPMSMGRLQLRQGKREDAIRSFKQALKFDADSSAAHQALGAALFEQGHFSRAIRHCSEVDRDTYIYADACNVQGMALYCQGKGGAAKFRKAVAKRPKDAWFHLNLALALHDQGKTVEGMHKFAEALRLCPDCIAQAAQQAWTLATHPDRQRRDPGTALIRARQVCLAPGPHGPQDLDTLAVAYAALGRYKAATATAQKALRQAQAAKDAKLIRRIEQQLTLFRKRQPYVSKETVPFKPSAKAAIR